MELRDTVSIVTGGTGGLGQRICHALVRAGSFVVVVYAQRREVANEVRDALIAAGGQASVEQCDQGDEMQVRDLIERVVAQHGHIDVLINDAATNKSLDFNDFANMELADWNTLMTVNLTGPMLFARAVAPFMKAQGRGRIVNIASVAGLTPSGSSIPYAVSKAGLIHLTRCLAVGLAPEILVNCVAPGFIEGTKATSNLSNERIKMVKEQSLLKKPADKNEIAQQVIRFCEAETTTGQTIVIDAGRYFH